MNDLHCWQTLGGWEYKYNLTVLLKIKICDASELVLDFELKFQIWKQSGRCTCMTCEKQVAEISIE